MLVQADLTAVNLGLGGLVGDIGINTNLPGGSHTTTTSSVVNLTLANPTPPVQSSKETKGRILEAEA